MLRSLGTFKNIRYGFSNLPKTASGSIGNRRFASKWRNENKTDDKIQVKWFLLVAAFGTMVYVTVMQRIQEQDHSKNLEKYKKTFTEEEWNQYINEIQRKRLTLESDEECFLIPFTYNNTQSKDIKQIVEKLGGESNVGIIDLNNLVSNQLHNNSKYHVLLSQTLEDELKNSDSFRYKFSYKLKPGIFTQIISDEIIRIKSDSPSLGRFLILNYPPNIKEAIKFEQNVCKKDTLLVLNSNSNESDIVQYFETVDKVVESKKLGKLDPLFVKIDSNNLEAIQGRKIESDDKVILKTLSNVEPSNDAPAIEKAQYKLRQMNQPIREYGESDLDVINRLKNLQK